MREKNESCRSDYHQSSERILAEPGDRTSDLLFSATPPTRIWGSAKWSGKSINPCWNLFSLLYFKVPISVTIQPIFIIILPFGIVYLFSGEYIEQDQPAHTRSLILLYTLRRYIISFCQQCHLNHWNLLVKWSTIWICNDKVLTLSQISPVFLRICSISLLKTSNFSFSHSVFYPFAELSPIFMKLNIVVCKLFQSGTV